MNVVWLASFPRSGVTYLRHVLEQLYGIPTWTLYKNEHVASGTLVDSKRWPDQADGSLPVYFVKTHLAETAAANQPAIHLVRDGRDVIISLAHYAKDILERPESFEALLNGLIQGNTTLGHWGLHTMAYAGRRTDTAFMSFGQLIRHPVETVRCAVELLGLPLMPRECCNLEQFEALHKTRPQFFRSGKMGQWKTVFSEAQLQRFNAIHGGAMHWLERARNEEQERIAGACSAVA